MRTEQEMIDLVLDTAKKDERVRVVGMNGSRTNPNVPKDKYQDYDVVYVVTDMKSFLEDPSWVDIFGERIIIQMPEAMDMFPPSLGNWFSYLMLFEDHNRIDLILVPLDELDKYIKDDKLIEILLDKDGWIQQLPPSTDIDYHVKKPSESYFDDCCNEFWWISTYVAKGLCRGELPYAIDHLNFVRNFLFMMLSWEVGARIGFSASMGKNYKYLNQYLSAGKWSTIMRTYRNDSNEAVWESLWLCCDMFRESGQSVAALIGAPYPEYDSKVTAYLKALYNDVTP